MRGSHDNDELEQAQWDEACRQVDGIIARRSDGSDRPETEQSQLRQYYMLLRRAGKTQEEINAGRSSEEEFGRKHGKVIYHCSRNIIDQVAREGIRRQMGSLYPGLLKQLDLIEGEPQ